MFLGGLALRPVLVGVAPLLVAIKAELGVSHAVAGLLVAIPALGLGLLAPVGAALVARRDSRTVMAASLALIGLFGLARAVSPDVGVLLLTTAGFAAALGIAGAVLPIIVKERRTDHGLRYTALYAFGIQLGAGFTPAVSARLAEAGAGWRGSLAIVALLPIVLAVAWLVLTPRVRIRAPSLGGRWRAVLVDRRWWAMTAAFALTSTVFYGVVAWLPAAFTERGWDAAPASDLLTVLSLAGLAGTVLVPWLSGGPIGPRWSAVGAAAVAAAAMAALVVLPEWALAWSAVSGIGIGVVFTVNLAAPLGLSRDPRVVGQASALMFLVGYAFAAASPVALGAIRDAAGSFTVSLWALAAVAAILPLVLWPVAPAPRPVAAADG
jgi:CP family cyanate transporter-like MFS transporter